MSEDTRQTMQARMLRRLAQAIVDEEIIPDASDQWILARRVPDGESRAGTAARDGGVDVHAGKRVGPTRIRAVMTPAEVLNALAARGYSVITNGDRQLTVARATLTFTDPALRRQTIVFCSLGIIRTIGNNAKTPSGRTRLVGELAALLDEAKAHLDEVNARRDFETQQELARQKATRAENEAQHLTIIPRVEQGKDTTFAISVIVSETELDEGVARRLNAALCRGAR